MNDQVNNDNDQHSLHMQKAGESYNHKVRMQNLANNYNLLLLNWYFLLNSGGLIGTITLLTVKNETHRPLCVILFLFFLIGLIFTIISCKLDYGRILPEFDKSIKKETIPNIMLVTTCEYLSIIFFMVGLLIGIITLALKS